MDDPSLAACVEHLYAGPQSPLPPVFDWFLSLTGSDFKPKKDVDTTSPVLIDSSRIEGVRTFNSFWPQRLVHSYTARPDGDSPPPILTSKNDSPRPPSTYCLR